MKLSVVVTLVSLLGVAGSSPGVDWPQWQGPGRDSKSTDTGLLQEWPEAGPSLAWRIENCGGGDSARSIANGRIYGMGNRDDQEIVWALSETDGKEIWVTPLGPAFEQRASQAKERPGCTPTVDGERLYYRMEDGTVVLIEPSPKQYIEHGRFEQPDRRKPPAWAHPVIANGKLYLRDQDLLFCYNVEAH